RIENSLASHRAIARHVQREGSRETWYRARRSRNASRRTRGGPSISSPSDRTPRPIRNTRSPWFRGASRSSFRTIGEDAADIHAIARYVDPFVAEHLALQGDAARE